MIFSKRKNKIFSILAIFTIIFFAINVPAHAFQKYMSIKSNQANVRKGPGTSYPIEWMYQRKGLPVKILEIFENWRKIQDYKNRVGWIHENLLSKSRYVIVVKNDIPNHNHQLSLNEHETLLFRRDSEYSYPTARIQLETIGKVIKCKKNWCKIAVANHKNWIHKYNLWGIDSDELF